MSSLWSLSRRVCASRKASSLASELPARLRRASAAATAAAFGSPWPESASGSSSRSAMTLRLDQLGPVGGRQVHPRRRAQLHPGLVGLAQTPQRLGPAQVVVAPAGGVLVGFSE